MQKKKESLCAQDPGGTSTLLTLQQKQHHLQSSLSRATLLSYKIIIILITKHACNALKSVFIAARSQWAAGWIHMKGLTLGDWTGAGEVSAGRSATEWSIHTDHSQLRRGPTGLQESTEAPFIFFWWKLLVGSSWSVGIDDGVMKIMSLEGESFLQKKIKELQNINPRHVLSEAGQSCWAG